MSIPDFEAIGRALDTAEPLEMHIMPFRAFCLVSLLHLAMRHPRLKLDTPTLAEVAESMVQNLTAKLGEVDPALSAALETGRDRSMDMTRQEFELYEQGEYEPGSNCSFVQLRPELKGEILAQSMVMVMACEHLAQQLGGGMDD